MFLDLFGKWNKFASGVCAHSQCNAMAFFQIEIDSFGGTGDGGSNYETIASAEISSAGLVSGAAVE